MERRLPNFRMYNLSDSKNKPTHQPKVTNKNKSINRKYTKPLKIKTTTHRESKHTEQPAKRLPQNSPRTTKNKSKYNRFMTEHTKNQKLKNVSYANSGKKQRKISPNASYSFVNMKTDIYDEKE
jgi:hypothetical protein